MEGSVVLVAHGCLRQQGKVLLRNLEEFQISYDEVISGFTDSLVAAEKLVPSAECHSLEGMLRQLGLASNEVDDAVEKAHDVRRVCQVISNHVYSSTSHSKPHQVLANLCRMKFLDFILDKDWSCSVAEQWDCAFE